MSKYYITMAIPYVNDRPHIGHSLLAVATDISARYFKQVGKDVFFLTGTDEHGLKIQQAAEKDNKDPGEFADKVSEEFKKAWKLLNINYNYFIRTTNPQHKKLSQQFLHRLYESGYIYKDIYEGLYCVGCEKFLTDLDLNEDKKCPLHKPEQTIFQREDNYFFKLGDIAQKKVSSLIKNDTIKITPEERKKEILSRVDRGVDDISISREKLGWGVQIPWDNTHTVYVWVEALLNYWTAPQITNCFKIWPPDLQIIGKDILWFHAVIWPSLLLAAQEKLPKELFVHSFYLLDGQKMSKSLGNIITPRQLVDRYGVDGTRYLIAKSIPYSTDSDVDIDMFDKWYNADLANGLGNLTARVKKLREINKVKSDNKFTPHIPYVSNIRGYHKHMKNYQFHLALEAVWREIKKVDIAINKDKPWKKNSKEANPYIINYINDIQNIAFALQPFMPETSANIISQLSDNVKKKNLFPRI